VILVVATATASVNADGIGDRLFRGYTTYAGMPITVAQAQQQGWVPTSSATSCQPGLGIQYAADHGGVSTGYPISLYFTPAGQVASIGMNVYGEPKAPPNSYVLIRDSPKTYLVTVSFRNSSATCSGQPFPTLPLGDQLVINQARPNIAQALPITTSQALVGNWTKGACFDGMGTHYFYDVTSGGKPIMSWKAANLLPIIPMYYQGKINAFFFASSAVQQGLLSANMWDKIPLPNLLMCKNWCDPKCTFADTSFYSTGHIYLTDYTQVKCGGGCTISCCPGMGNRTASEEKELAEMMHEMHGGN